MNRLLTPQLLDALDHSPAVALLGPRQSGNTSQFARNLGVDMKTASWECFVAENLIANADGMTQPYFYRSSGGAGIDLLLPWPDGRLWAIEIKRSLTPKLERGFHAACADLKSERRFVVYPGSERYRLAEDIEAIPLPLLARTLRGD